MTTRTFDRAALEQCVGAVVIAWTDLEGALKAFLYDLSAFNAAAFEEADSFKVLSVFLSHMDVRAVTANAKALAFNVRGIPDFYERVEAVMNRIDNELRNERHRYVHDIWRMWGPGIYRIQSGMVVRRRPPDGERWLHQRRTKQYFGPTELIKFANDIKETNREVEALGHELRQKLNEIRPQPE